MNAAEMIGKPMLWKTEVYGSVAVHIKGFSPNGQEIPKPPKKDRAKSAGAVVSFFTGGHKGGRGK